MTNTLPRREPGSTALSEKLIGQPDGWFEAAVRESLVPEDQRTRKFLVMRHVQRVAVLAAVDFRIRAKFLLHFIAEPVPPLQVPGADSASLGVSPRLITGPLARHGALHLGSI